MQVITKNINVRFKCHQISLFDISPLCFSLSVCRHEWGQSVILFCWFKTKIGWKKHCNISLYVLHNTTCSKYNPIDHTQDKQGSVKSQRKLYFLVWVNYGVILTLTSAVWFLWFGLVWFITVVSCYISAKWQSDWNEHHMTCDELNKNGILYQ